jgi:hypothetical protein
MSRFLDISNSESELLACMNREKTAIMAMPAQKLLIPDVRLENFSLMAH